MLELGGALAVGGDGGPVVSDDDWTAVTADGKRTAQFEHTVLVTDDSIDVLTGGPGKALSASAPWDR